MRCDKCDKRKGCKDICDEIEKQLQKELTINKDDAFNYLYEKPYDPEELFKRFYDKSTPVAYSYWGFSTPEEATETLKVVIQEKLNARQKLILKLYYESGLTHKQIADLLDRKRHTITDNLKRIRAKVRRELEFLLKTFKNPTK